MTKTNYRSWEYADKGDYHKSLDFNWCYAPTYLKKMHYVRKFLDSLPKEAKILDIGCGEGVLVNEYRARGYAISGIDLNYASDYILRGDVLNMPFEDEVFDVILLLDVFEHLTFEEQPEALKEIRRVLCSEGHLVASIPNLSHMNSRIKFCLLGRFQRADCEENHPGERPVRENIALLKQSGFKINKIIGITLTFPGIYDYLICRKPKQFLWLHNLLNLVAIPSLALLNLFICQKS